MRRRGFTITELLVVIAITSVLLGFLLPALSSVRVATKQLQCQSNLRQMAIAAQKYASIWQMYPAAIRYEQVDGVVHRVAWDWVTIGGSDPQVVSPGPLWEFTGNPDRAMQCPGYDGPSNFDGDPYTGYNYNTDYVGGEAMSAIVGWDIVRPGVPPYACARSDRTAIFGCGGWRGGANKFMRAPLNPNGWPLPQVYSGGQAFHYRGYTNVAYIDTHVASVCRPEKGELHDEALLDEWLGWPENGFLSSDDSAYDPR
jgi:prepilin-type N-terminal cleavage/methylation domain-containing protein